MRAWGTLIHEKNLKSKISWQTSFNGTKQFLGSRFIARLNSHDIPVGLISQSTSALPLLQPVMQRSLSRVQPVIRTPHNSWLNSHDIPVGMLSQSTPPLLLLQPAMQRSLGRVQPANRTPHNSWLNSHDIPVGLLSQSAYVLTLCSRLCSAPFMIYL